MPKTLRLRGMPHFQSLAHITSAVRLFAVFLRLCVQLLFFCTQMCAFIGIFVRTSHSIKKIEKRLKINVFSRLTHVSHVRFPRYTRGVLSRWE